MNLKLNSNCILIQAVFITLLWGCQKGNLYLGESEQVVKVDFKGYVTTDTLEFVKNGNVICEAIESTFIMKGGSLVSTGEMMVRKKDTGESVGNITVSGDSYNQVFPVFYDGDNFSDRISIPPVSDPGKIGLQLSMVSSPEYMAEGPYDIAIILQSIITDPVDFTSRFEYKPISIIKNVGADFTEFMELPALLNEDPLVYQVYTFQVFEAGTTTYPFKPEVDFSFQPIADHYPQLFTMPGQTSLFRVSPNFDGNHFFQFDVVDIASYFQ